jgi:hypothetical protein
MYTKFYFFCSMISQIRFGQYLILPFMNMLPSNNEIVTESPNYNNWWRQKIALYVNVTLNVSLFLLLRFKFVRSFAIFWLCYEINEILLLFPQAYAQNIQHASQIINAIFSIQNDFWKITDFDPCLSWLYHFTTSTT